MRRGDVLTCWDGSLRRVDLVEEVGGMQWVDFTVLKAPDFHSSLEKGESYRRTASSLRMAANKPEVERKAKPSNASVAPTSQQGLFGGAS